MSPYSADIVNNDVPCWYRIGFNSIMPAVTVELHVDFLKYCPVDLVGRMGESLRESFGFSQFNPDLRNGDFGFNKAFVRVEEKDSFITFAADIPAGIGPIPTDGENPFYAISATFNLFFSLMTLGDESVNSTGCTVPQLIVLQTTTSKRILGGSISGTYSIPLVKWLTTFESGAMIGQVGEAMGITYEKIHGELSESARQANHASVENEKGFLLLRTVGNSTGIHPNNSSDVKIGKGYDFSSSNTDNVLQQLVLLSGLGALHDQARREIGI